MMNTNQNIDFIGRNMFAVPYAAEADILSVFVVI